MSASLPILDELPTGYFVDESPRGILVLHVDAARGIHETGYGPEHDGDLRVSELSGRRPLHELVVEGKRLIVRRFSHGGLMRWITGERYLDPQRPFRELLLSDTLRRAGIATPQVVGARSRPAKGWGWNLDLISRHVPGTTDLGFLLRLARRGELQESAKHALLRETGSLVRKMHRHGCLHADLTPTNILTNADVVEGQQPKLWVIDLDQSIIREKPTRVELLQNLRRLYRYVARREHELGPVLSAKDYQRFMMAYEPKREKRRALMKEIQSAHRRRQFLHGLGWLFERLFRTSTDPRN